MFPIKLLGILLEPLLSLLVLYIWSPEDDFGEIIAFIFWPFFHFIIGLILSCLDQPRVTVDSEGDTLSTLDKKKMRMYHYRLLWLLFLTLFEFFGAIFVLAADQGISVQCWFSLAGLYVVYALFAISWLKKIKLLKSPQARC